MIDLAHRVETEEPSAALNEDIARATGWTVERNGYGRDAEGKVVHLPNWLTSTDAAKSLMPEGWKVDIYLRGERCYVTAHKTGLLAQSAAPTEPQARTAAALRAIEAEPGIVADLARTKTQEVFG